MLTYQIPYIHRRGLQCNAHCNIDKKWTGRFDESLIETSLFISTLGHLYAKQDLP